MGIFPTGRNPGYDVWDLAGNVWEWCSTVWDDKAYPFQIKEEWAAEYLRTDVHRVLRGGAFLGGAADMRGAARPWNLPYFRNWDLGFRVVRPPRF